MEKSELVTVIAKKANITKAKAKELFEAIIETLQKALIKGEVISLKNFGTLCVTTSKERIGRNPKTGEVVSIPACRKVKFKTSKHLKSTIN